MPRSSHAPLPGATNDGAGPPSITAASDDIALRNPSAFHSHAHAPSTPKGDLAAVWDLLTSSYVNCLLIFVPLGIAAGIMEWGAVTVFTLNFLALVPLALILGDVTEDLALR